MEIRTGSLNFPTEIGRGSQKKEVIFNFNQTVKQAVAGIAGTNFGFTKLYVCQNACSLITTFRGGAYGNQGY